MRQRCHDVRILQVCRGDGSHHDAHHVVYSPTAAAHKGAEV